MATFTTTLASLGGAKAGSVRVRQLGTIPDSAFNTTLAQSLQSATKTGLTFDGVDKLSFAEGFKGPIVITRTTTAPPATGATHALQFFELTGNVTLPQATVAAVSGTPTLPSFPAMLKGANLSGMEFKPNNFVQTHAAVDYYASQGFNCLRIPCLWERMQLTVGGPITSDGSTKPADKYKDLVNYVISKGMYCVVDSAHNYSVRIMDSDGVIVNSSSTDKATIGSDRLPVTAFDDYCMKLYAFLGDGGGKIIYDLMNEPSGTNWGPYASSHIAAFRAAGCVNRIHAYYTANSLSGTHDPLNNTVFDAHRYLDPTAAGVSGVCSVGAGTTRLTDIANNARSQGKKLFLGEFAAGYPTITANAQCATELPAHIDKVQNEPSLWTGWTAWGGGRNWTNDYIFRLEYGDTTNTADTPYMSILKSKL